MKKWYYTCFINHKFKVSVFETDQYEGRGGYSTKKEAILAAIDNLSKDLKENIDKIKWANDNVTDLTKSIINLNMELFKETNEQA